MIEQRYAEWVKNAESEEWLERELSEIKDKPAEIEDRFFRHLEFGTGGLRGVIGAGTNRMNVFTIKRASQGFANYLNKQPPSGAAASGDAPQRSVVISYDSRNFSDKFARAAAEVFASNGIKTHIFDRLQPTPLCSFAVRKLKADAGVMVTASHNPKIYNGYKAYGADGCQITTETADAVLSEINAIEDYFGVKTETFEALLRKELISYIPDSVYEDFLTEVEKLSVSDGKEKKAKIVYSPLNGTGNVPVREILARRGFKRVTVVPEQELPDGDFTTCPFPNPEEKDALALAIALAEKEEADLVLATDPDCDRVGIAVRYSADRYDWEYRLISGNEVGILMTYYLLSRRKAQGTLPKDPLIIKTIVSTDLVVEIAKDFSAEVKDVLTGFKYIGELVTDLESRGEDSRFVLGFEESYGYATGTHVRDKDAVNAAMVIAEMCEYFLENGSSISEVLDGIYKLYGYSKSFVKSYAFVGSAGIANMNKKLSALRKKPFKTLGGMKVLSLTDYISGADGLPPSDVLSFQLHGTKVVIRPSGTEPKLKIYILAKSDSEAGLKKIADAVFVELDKHFG